MSGIVDQSDSIHLGGYPGPLRKVLGIWVEEIDALAPGMNNTLKTDDCLFNKKEYTYEMLCDLIHLEGAELIVQYDSDFYKGMPAITKNSVGSGEAWYVGTVPEQDMLNELIAHILNKKGIKGFDHLPEGVEITTRENETAVYHFVMNHTNDIQEIQSSFKGYTDLLTNQNVSEKITLKPYDVKLLVKK